MRRGLSLVFTIIIIGLYISLFAITSTSLYSIASTLMGSLIGIEDIDYTSSEDEVTGIVNMTMCIPVNNQGVLDVKVKIGFRMFSVNESVLAESSDTKNIAPGDTAQFVISTSFLPEDVENVEVSVECRSFFDMIGLSFCTKLEEYPSSEE